MGRRFCRTFVLGWLALLLCGTGLTVSAQSQTEREAAQRRLAELAQRYGTAQNVAATADEPSTPGESAALEELPLGAGADTIVRGAEAVGTNNASGLEEPAGGYVLSTLAALGVVIGLVFAARWAYVRMGGTVVARPTSVVEVLSRTAVTPKNHVLLLRVGQRVLVVGDSGGGGLRTLADLDDPEEVASVLQSVTAGRETSATRSFNALISRFQQDPAGPSRRDLEGGDDGEIHLDRTRDALSGLANRLRTLGGQDTGGGLR